MNAIRFVALSLIVSPTIAGIVAAQATESKKTIHSTAGHSTAGQIEVRPARLQDKTTPPQGKGTAKATKSDQGKNKVKVKNAGDQGKSKADELGNTVRDTDVTGDNPGTAAEDKTPPQGKAQPEAPQVNPIDQLKNSLNLATREAKYLESVKKSGGLLHRFKRNRATARGLIQAFTPKQHGPALPPKSFVARLLGDLEKAKLGKEVIFTVQRIPVTQAEFDQTVEFLGSYPRPDSTEDVKTAAITAIVTAKAGQGIHPQAARKAYDAILDLAAKLESGASFSELAKQHSDDDATAKNGGKREYIVRKTADKNYARTAFALKVGEVSDVVATLEGYHIIRLLAKKAGETPDLDRALTSHILKRFTDTADQRQSLLDRLESGQVDVAFRSDELRQYAPTKFR